MDVEYKVDAFKPTIKGCGSVDKGWNEERQNQFQQFLNDNATDGWELHSSEYRTAKSTAGCGNQKGQVLVCIFERERK